MYDRSKYKDRVKGKLIKVKRYVKNIDSDEEANEVKTHINILIREKGKNE